MNAETRSICTRIFISVTAVGIILFLMRDKLSETAHILRSEVMWSWILVGIVIYLLANILLALRLRLILQVQEISVTVKESIHLVFVGLFFNLFLPSAVGGDLAKAYYAYKHSGKKMAATTAIILDRLVGFVTLIVMALIAVAFFNDEIHDNRVGQVIMAFAIMMILIVSFFLSKRFAKRFGFLKRFIPSEKWKKRLEEIYHSFYNYKNHRGVLAGALSLALTGQVFFILTYYIITLSLGVQLNLWIFFILIPMISIVSMAPSLGGLGVREAGAIYLFGKFMGTERAFALALLADVLVYGVSLAAGIYYGMRGGLKRKFIHEIEELK